MPIDLQQPLTFAAPAPSPRLATASANSRARSLSLFMLPCLHLCTHSKPVACHVTPHLIHPVGSVRLLTCLSPSHAAN
eukprot:293550-Pleurochrysis_carterae.AAC.1